MEIVEDEGGLRSGSDLVNESRVARWLFPRFKIMAADQSGGVITDDVWHDVAQAVLSWSQNGPCIELVLATNTRRLT